MGDRVSVSFVKVGKDYKGKAYTRESVAFFAHWGGTEFLGRVQAYLRELHKKIKRAGRKGIMPIDRMEPGTVMVDFIRWLTCKMPWVESDYYLGTDENDGDNSDNGHHRFDVDSGSEYYGPAEFKGIGKTKEE